MERVVARDPGGHEWTITRRWIPPRWRRHRSANWDLHGVDLSSIADDGSLTGILVAVVAVALLTIGLALFVTVLWPLLLLVVELAIVVPLVFLRRYRLAATDGSAAGTVVHEVRGWRRSRRALRTAVERIERGETPFPTAA